MYDKDDYLYQYPIKEFPSRKETMKYLVSLNYKLSHGNISKACYGKKQTCCGYRGRYKDEVYGF